MANGEESRVVPPYLPFKSLTNYVGKLSETVVPSLIDASVMRGLSGSSQSQLKTGLRFLGLITDEGTVTPEFRTLVAAYNTPRWKEALGVVIQRAYARFTDEIDLETTTLNQLTDRFRKLGGAEGSSLEKAVRFYLAAADEIGLSVSPHLKGRRSANSTARARTRSRQNGKASSAPRNGADAPDIESKGGGDRDESKKLFRFPLPGKSDAVIQLPAAVSETEWNLVDTYVRAYLGLARTE